MKKFTAAILLLSLILSLCACGGKAEAPKVELQPIYDGFASMMPDMLILDSDNMLNMLGVRTEDCEQAITAICSYGLQADEVWLIQAKDADALARIQALAETRLHAKADETEFYLPEQYLIVKEGQIIVNGLYLALLVSPEVSTMVSQFEAAFK